MSEEQKDLNELITLAEEVKNKIAESNLPVDALQSVEGHVNELIDLAKKEQIVNEVEAEVQEELKAEVIEGDGVSEEPQELTDEEKRELFIQQLKASKIKFKPVKHFVVKTNMVLTDEVDVLGKKKKRKDTTIITNITTNPYGTAYKKERRRKNKVAKASRRVNR